jgi:RimJ/RimL family protein N-acetyltransferase
MQPVLECDLLLLRPLVTGDFDALYAIASDPAVWEQHPSKDRVLEPVFRRWFDEALASGGALVAVDKVADQVIGTSRYAITGDSNSIEIGWTFLDRSRWGGTYNGEMKRLMIEHASASVQGIVFTVHSLNKRSQNAVERLGARRVATEPDCHGRGENIVYRLEASARENSR